VLFFAAGQLRVRSEMAEVTKTTHGETYVQTDDDFKVIPGSKRADGTMRKEIKVKAGYTPPEETKYMGPAAKAAAAAGATGYPAADAAPEKPRIPGFTGTGLEEPFQGKPAPKKKNRNRGNKNKGEKADEGEAAAAEETKDAPKKEEAKEDPKKDGPSETEKEIKKRNKKIREIDALLERGTPLSLEEQKKVDNKNTLVKEIKHLEKVAKGIVPAVPVAPKSKAAPPPAIAAAASKKEAAAPVEPVVKAGAPVVVPFEKKSKAKAKAKAAAKPAPVAPAELTEEEKVAKTKRLRNVRKKLKDIEETEKKTELTADQQAKIAGKKEVLAEEKDLVKALGL